MSNQPSNQPTPHHAHTTSGPSQPAAGPGTRQAEDVPTLGTVTDLPTAAALLGLSRSSAYDLAKRDQFPVPVIRAGRRYRVPVAPLLATLGINPHHPAAGALDPTGQQSLDHHTESQPHQQQNP